MTDKKKQIADMAEFINVDSSFQGFEEDALQLAEELYKEGYRKHVKGECVEVVRCKDCDVLHNKWTGCPNLNGMIPPPDFYCAKGKQKQQDAAAENPDAQRAAMHMESFSLFCPKCQKEYEEFMKGGESDDRRRKAD